jgi:TolB-like protein
MADDHTFLLPLAIDDTGQTGARVPDKFLAVQWLRVPGGEPTPALEAMCRRLVSGEPAGPAVSKKALSRPGKLRPPMPAAAYPEFPKQEPGQMLRFSLRVVGWGVKSTWVFFRQLPRWIKIVVYLWIAVVLLDKGCTPGRHHSADLSPASAQKLKAISDQYRGSTNKADVAKLGAQIAREFSEDSPDPDANHGALLAIPFTAPPGDAAAEKLADAAFAQVYGRISISHSGHVGLSKDPLDSQDVSATLQRARSAHSNYVLSGAVENLGASQVLTVKIVTVSDGEVRWTKSYPSAAADPAKIADEVNAEVPALDDD